MKTFLFFIILSHLTQFPKDNFIHFMLAQTIQFTKKKEHRFHNVNSIVSSNRTPSNFHIFFISLAYNGIMCNVVRRIVLFIQAYYVYEKMLKNREGNEDTLR